MKNHFSSHGSQKGSGPPCPHRMPFHLFIEPLMKPARNRKRSVGVRPYLECLEARSLLTAVSAVSPAGASVGVGIAAKVQATFDAAVQPNNISFKLTDPNNTTIPGRVTYNAANNTATFDSNAPLAYSTTYTAAVSGAASKTWSFTTGLNPNNGPGGPILVVTAAANPFSNYYAEILRRGPERVRHGRYLDGHCIDP